MMLAAAALAGLMNTLAALQAGDCLTTHALVAQEHQPGRQTVEADPIARVIHADTSMPVCFASAAVINLAIRATHQTWLAKTAIVFEVAAVGTNVGVLLRFTTK